jgi:hypothetical protein
MTTRTQIEWRRAKVFEMLSMGNSQTDIAKHLHVDMSIISRDVSYLRLQAKRNIHKYIDERLPEEYEKCLVGVNAILKEAWSISQQAEDRREKIQALSLAKECYAMKLDLLTNATVVDDAIRFVSANGKSTIEKPETGINANPFTQVNAEFQIRGADYKTHTPNTNQVF